MKSIHWNSLRVSFAVMLLARLTDQISAFIHVPSYASKWNVQPNSYCHDNFPNNLLHYNKQPLNPVSSNQDYLNLFQHKMRSPKPIFSSSQGEGEYTKQSEFDMESAVLLAGFAFRAYDDPKSERWQIEQNSTQVTMLDADSVHKVFRGSLVVTVQKANLPFYEKEFMESFRGRKIDPYVLLEVVDSISDDFSNTAKSTVQPKAQAPEWKEKLQLYVRNPDTASLKVTVMDKDRLSTDDKVAVAQPLKLHEIVEKLDPANPSDYWKGTVPLYSSLIDTNLGGGDQSPSIDLEIRYIPFDIVGVEGEDDSADNANDPKDKTTAIEEETEKEEFDSIESWCELRNKAGGLALEYDSFSPVAFIENIETDTQAGIWKDKKSKRIIVSFRGTETTELKDILTDIQLFQEPWEWEISATSSGMSDDFYKKLDSAKAKLEKIKEQTEGNQSGFQILSKALEDALKNIPAIGLTDSPCVHSGFKKAYKSIQPTLHDVLDIITTMINEEESWHIYLTGHSLGGALAQLATFDLSYRSEMQHHKFTMYNYGAPRVGNLAFARACNSNVQDMYRIVNGDDVVAIMPRGKLLEYSHAGKVVCINDMATDVWIEGESEGLCPVEQLDQWDAYGAVTNVDNKINSGAVNIMGSDDEFVDAEIRLWNCFKTGDAINSHFEHMYHNSFLKTFFRV